MARKHQDRKSRVQAMRQAEQARERRGRLALWGGVGAVVATLLGVTAWAVTDRAGGIDGVRSYGGLGRDHVAGPVTYARSPSVGGDHNAIWQNCGVYDEPVVEEFATHSLEHGAVWITYRPDIGTDQIAITERALGSSGYVLISPYPDQDSPVVLSAWGKQLAVRSVDDDRADQFLQRYVQGSQTPEPGAACSGGVAEDGDAAQRLLSQLAAPQPSVEPSP